MVSLGQISALIDFLEVHPELALGRCTRTKEGRSLAKRLWAECADVLNNFSADCTTKTAESWRIYYNDYKSKLLKKIKAEKGEISATGGGPTKIIPLTSLQERLYTILGRDVGEPLEGVRHNPLSQIENVVEDQDGTQNSEMIWNDEEMVEHVEEAIIMPEPVEEAIIIQEVNNRQLMEEVNNRRQPEQEVRPQQDRETPPAPSQRRRRRRRRQSSPETDTQNPSMREASELLGSMERMSAEATRLHAAATNRLAAAIEALGERLREPIIITLQDPPLAMRRGRRINISDSESE